jgi:hypothetical protein
MVSFQGSLEDRLALVSGSTTLALVSGSTTLALVSATTSADMSKQSKHMYFTKEDEGILQNIEGVGCNTMNPLLFLVSYCASYT